MTSALIGHTGFVGSNLDRQYRFTDRYNSSNIGEISGREFDIVFCAGIQAKKWWANQHREEDLAGIKKLLSSLKNMRTKAFVLISTVDVYAYPIGVDESVVPDETKLHPYGLHRMLAERFVRENVDDHLIIRLPGLFGDGLKKNVIYDLLHDNGLENISPEGVFQYYFLDNLKRDIDRCLDAGLKVVNFATEPVKTADIIAAYFEDKRVGEKAGSAGMYDVRTRHSSLWGRNDGYICGKEEVLRDLGTFIERTRIAAV